jgi:hypothetical protein
MKPSWNTLNLLFWLQALTCRLAALKFWMLLRTGQPDRPARIASAKEGVRLAWAQVLRFSLPA